MAFNPDNFGSSTGGFNPDNFTAEGFNPDKFSKPEPDDLPPLYDPIRREANAPDVPSLGERLIRQQKLGIRNVIEGAAGFPVLVGDAANTVLNFIPGVNLRKPSEVLDTALTEVGFPVPETQAERVAQTVTEAVAGAIGGIGVAKNIRTPYSALMVEQAGQQVTAAAAGGAAMAAARENDVGPLGQLAIATVAAIGGGVAHSGVSTQFGRRFEQRLVLKDKELAASEVREMLAKEDVKVGEKSEELRQLTEQLNELRVQGKIQERVRQLAPKKSDTVEQARYKRRETEKLGSPEAGLPVEVVRERERIRTRQIADIEAKIRQQENNAVTSKPAVAKARSIAATSADQTEQAISRAMAVKVDPTVPRVERGEGVGRLRKRDAWGNAVIDRIQAISPQMAIAVRRVTQRAATRTNDDVEGIMKFYDSPQYNRLPKSDKVELDRHLLNGDDEAAKSIMQRVDGLNELYTENVRSLLYKMQKERIAKGATGYHEDFHPRVVKSVSGLRRAAGRKGRGGRLDQALADAQRESKARRGHPLDEREVAALINEHLGGRPLKVLKDRRINEIEPDMQKYYETSRNSLIDYIHKFHTDDATREFFKNSLGKEVDFGKNAVNEVTVGQLLAKSLQEHGGLDPNSLGEMGDLLAVHFGVGRQGVGAFQRNFKNLFTTATLGFNPVSTVTQFGDVAPVMKKFGVRDTLLALNPLRNKANDLSVYDIGVRELSKDLRTVHGTSALVRRGLKAAGFDKLDTIMAGAGVRAANRKWTGMARRNPAATQKALEKFFGSDAEQMVKDLQAGKVTDDIKTWYLHEIGNIRPISREDMPVHFNANPNGRWMYSLLSWTIKQMNFARNSALADWRAGRKLGAVKNLGALALLMGMTNGSVGVIKDFMMGRDIDPASDFAAGMLAMGMSGKYALEALQSNRGLGALGSIIPALGITADAIQKVFTGTVNGDVAKLLEATPSGRNLVNLMAGPIVPAVGAAVNALIPDAGASPADVGRQQVAARPTPAPAPQPRPTPQPIPQPSGAVAYPADDRGAALRRIAASQREVAPDVQRQAPSINSVQAPKVNVPVGGGIKAAKELLVAREGLREEVYQNEIKDGKGGTKLDKPTAGIGHVLTAEELRKYPVGSTVPKDVIDKWFRSDSAKAFAKAQSQAKEVGKPELVPVLTSVNFQLGTDWNQKFKETWRLMKEGKWEEASAEAADSLWAVQTPERLHDLQDALRKVALQESLGK